MGLEWSDSFAVGVEAIDRQHRELFARIDGLMSAMSQAKGREVVADLLLFLGEYVQVHFADEEELMRRRGYPGLEGHVAQHRGFAATFAQLRERLSQSGPTVALTIELNNKVCGWAVKHVLGSDRALGAFLQGRGAA
jgi:hemerythrin